MSEDTRLPLAPPDPATDLVGQLRAAAPQVFSEGRVDFDKLRAALGDQVEAGTERYGLGWAGKAEAFQNVRAPSVGTLLPMPGDSVNWDSTENLIIEGDNLEVLKLLQKPYHGRVKMIYIDPPYNTGNDFIYRDNYRQSLNDYLRFSGQLGEDGSAQSTNRDSSGRYHSDWLSMMYPRLFLARSLLREDGVIFVSIDDNEISNLWTLLKELFGEENFLACLSRRTKSGGGSAAHHFAVDNDFVLAFARNKTKCPPLSVPHNPEYLKRYSEEDRDGKYFWDTMERTYTQTKPYKITAPDGQLLDGSWFRSEDRFEKDKEKGEIRFVKKQDGSWSVQFKQRLSDGRKIRSLLSENEFKSNPDELEALGLGDYFSFPKPTFLIKHLLQGCTEKNDLILDFFAGSGTTAQSVFEQNQIDTANRRFLLVQLPEPTEYKNYPTIAHITRERVRRVIAKLDKEDGKKKSSRGFRAFRLSSSNFRIWNAGQTPEEATKLAEQLQLYSDNSGQARGEQDVLWELILKSGLPLSATVTKVKVDGGNAWSVDDNKLLILLDKKLSRETLRAMIALKPQRLLCLDAAFAGNDALKTSIVLEARSHGIAFHTV